jgi:7-cyano-7-deazaguanine synthase in queuosine biosynthesis
MNYKVKVGEPSTGYFLSLVPGKNLFSGIKAFENEFSKANSLETDILNLASGIFATDLAIPREEREHFIRNIELTIDVVNFHAFERVRNILENALYTVSRDNWTIKFIQKEGNPVAKFEWNQNDGAVLLFSGGLDSMCAASDLISKKTNLVLFSHNTQGNTITDNCQKNVHNALEDFYNQKIRHIHIKVFGRKLNDYYFPETRENTQRTRSFLFLCLAAIISRRCGFNKVIYMAENGQFSIHLPLNQARIGPFSTHTADPKFVQEVNSFLKILLINPTFEITNPFLYHTKAEVVSKLPKKLQEKARLSASCWMIHYIPQNKHCGYCIPCISRRIALEYNGINFKEYYNDIFNSDLNSLADSDDKKRNIIDYLEFILKFKNVTKANQDQLIAEFPELINDSFNLTKAIDLYKRVADQSFKVFEKYPYIKKIIG